jgi:hypothetical protein
MLTIKRDQLPKLLEITKHADYEAEDRFKRLLDG